jgi:hypothetical protein
MSTPQECIGSGAFMMTVRQPLATLSNPRNLPPFWLAHLPSAGVFFDTELPLSASTASPSPTKPPPSSLAAPLPMTAAGSAGPHIDFVAKTWKRLVFSRQR